MLALHMRATHLLKFQNSPKVQFVPQTPTDSWKPSECIPVSSPVSARVSGRYVASVFVFGIRDLTSFTSVHVHNSMVCVTRRMCVAASLKHLPTDSRFHLK